MEVTVTNGSKSKNIVSSQVGLFITLSTVSIFLFTKLVIYAGVIGVAIQLGVFGLILFISIELLKISAKDTQSRNFVDLMNYYFGRFSFLGYIAVFCLLVGNILSMHLYVVRGLTFYVIQLSVKTKITNIAGKMIWISFGIGVLSNLIIFPFLFLKQERLVKNISRAVSLIVHIILIILVVAIFWPAMFRINRTFDKIPLLNISNALDSSPFLLLSYSFIICVLLFSKKSKRSSFNLAFAILIVSLFLIGTGAAGFYLIGNDPNYVYLSNIFFFLYLNKPGASALLIALNILVIVMVIFINILNYLPIISLFMNLFKKKKDGMNQETSELLRNQKELDNNNENNILEKNSTRIRRKRIIVCILSILTLSLTAAIIFGKVHFDMIINFTGIFFAPLILIVIPGVISLLHISKFGQGNETGRKLISGLLIIIGLALWGFLSYVLIKGLLKN